MDLVTLFLYEKDLIYEEMGQSKLYAKQATLWRKAICNGRGRTSFVFKEENIEKETTSDSNENKTLNLSKKKKEKEEVEEEKVEEVEEEEEKKIVKPKKKGKGGLKLTKKKNFN